MNSNLTVNACICVRDGCTIRHLVNADKEIEFSFGSARYPFEIIFDVPALRHFMEVAGIALTTAAISIVHGENDDADQEQERP